MSSGWVRDSVFAAPLPPGWKLCFSVEPKTICLTLSVLLEALALGLEVALAELELALALAELELEHPAVATRPAATTVTLSQVALRRLKVFTKPVVCDPSDARHTGV